MSIKENDPTSVTPLTRAHDAAAGRRLRYSPLVHQVEKIFDDAVWEDKPRYLYILLEEDGRLISLSFTSAFSHRVLQGHANKVYKSKKSGLPPVLIMSLDLKKPFDAQMRASPYFSPEHLESWSPLRDHPLTTINFGGSDLISHAKPAGYLPRPDNVSDCPKTLKLIEGTWVKCVINNGFIDRTPKAGNPWQVYPI